MKVRLVVVTVLAAAVVCGPLAAAAGAHAAYRASDPPDESTVSEPPSQVWAEFTEPVVADSRLEVFDPCGAQVDAGNSTVTGYRITVGMSGSAAGTYTVRFEVVSAVDGHPTRGAFTFTSTGGDDCAGAAERPAEPEEEPREVRDPGGSRDRSVSRPVAEGDGPASDDDNSRERTADRRGEPNRPGGPADARSVRPGRDRRPVGDAAAPPTPDEREALEDLPLDGLVAGLLVSAVIGAAGGAVYAGIVGPRD